jgi:hypothetical protein
VFDCLPSVQQLYLDNNPLVCCPSNRALDTRGCRNLPFCIYQISSSSSSSSNSSSSSSSSFSYAECKETRTWEEIGLAYEQAQHMFKSGGLGTQETKYFQVWACFWDDPCLDKMAAQMDAMCYKYNESDGSWYPWILKSQMVVCV